jgi:PAS domain S-box-containing protein
LHVIGIAPRSFNAIIASPAFSFDKFAPGTAFGAREWTLMPIDERGADHDRLIGGGLSDRSVIDGLTAAWNRTTDALQDTERRYRELVEYSLGLICTHDLDGTILSINPAAAHSLGYQPKDGIGHDLRDFLSPDTRDLFDDYLDRIARNGQDAGLMRVVARSGETRVWMYRNVLSRDRHGAAHVIGHAIDITERVAVEQTLRESEQELRRAQAELEARVKERTAALERANERLQREIAERERAEESRERSLVEQRDTLAFLTSFSERLAPIVRFDELVEVIGSATVPFPADWSLVYVVNDDGSICAMPGSHADPSQSAVLSSLATSAAAAVAPGCLLAEVIAADHVAVETSASRNLAARIAGRRAAATVRRLGVGGVAMLPLSIAGRVRAVLMLVSRDPARFAGAGALLVENVARRLRLALDRIQLYREIHDANRLKDEFLSTLSHELRTPLNAIFGWARILHTRELDDSTAHAVDVIERNADAQLRLIEDVLDVSRIIAGKMTLQLTGLDLAGVVRATIDTVRPAMQPKGIHFTAALEDGLPPVMADAHRIQQAFSNVLSNAVKFTGAGGTIALRLHNAGQAVEFEVADSGVGIHRDVLPFVFDRFRQADSSLTRSHGGLGLGLAIVRHIVGLHGGTVTAASPGQGRGATFTIRLPAGDRRLDEPLSASAAVRARYFDVAPLLRGRTVLVVEDHDDARELIVRVLESAGADVISAATAAGAVEVVAAARPDVLVADIGLPDEDGYALLRRIRSEHGPELPAIALTAYARAADRERALAAGFQQHVVKPVDPQRLVEIVAASLSS